MASIMMRNSVLAIKEEVTEGTPVAPAAGTDFVALQPDFSMTPGIESISNEELKASLAPSKPQQGLENPQASFSHYFRPSGVVAQAPNYGVLLKSLLGAVDIAAAEYDTAASSTVIQIKVPSGEADTFERGEALLIKDSTNGYKIRCLDSADDTDLNLGFQVPTAPSSGVNLGRAVLYKPANKDQKTISLWHYLGNGGGVQLLSGGRPTSMDISITAGELINASYTVEGIKYAFDAIETTASTRFIDFTDDDGTFAAAVVAKMYSNPNDLAAAIQTAMNDTASTETYTVTYQNNDGKFKIVGTGTILTLKWNTGANTANSIASKIGFSTAADSSGTAATVGYIAPTAQSFVAPFTPVFDPQDPITAKYHEVMLGTQSDFACFSASEISISISTPKANVNSLCAESGVSGSVITGREVTISVVGLLSQYDAKPFYNFQVNQDIKFQYSFGNKSGGNWVAGKCGAIYSPTCVISNVEVTDQDGLARVNMELSTFVNSEGAGEFYINFL